MEIDCWLVGLLTEKAKIPGVPEGVPGAAKVFICENKSVVMEKIRVAKPKRIGGSKWKNLFIANFCLFLVFILINI